MTITNPANANLALERAATDAARQALSSLTLGAVATCVRMPAGSTPKTA